MKSCTKNSQSELWAFKKRLQIFSRAEKEEKKR